MAISYGALSITNAANATITANYNRTAILIQNLDAAISIYANFGAAAVASQCFIIRATQQLELTADKYPMIKEQLNLIAASGTPSFVAVDNI